MSDQKKIQDNILAKRDKYEKQGYADKDFEKKADGKLIKMWLPNSVFTQQKLLTIAAKVFGGDFNGIDEEAELTERYYKAVCNHCQIDGKELNAELLDLADLQAYALLYWVELLSPLSVWGDIKAKKAILD